MRHDGEYLVENVRVVVTERLAEPGVFDVVFAVEPRVGPSGFTLAYHPADSDVDREELLSAIADTIAGYAPDELELHREP